MIGYEKFSLKFWSHQGLLLPSTFSTRAKAGANAVRTMAKNSSACITAGVAFGISAAVVSLPAHSLGMLPNVKFVQAQSSTAISDPDDLNPISSDIWAKLSAKRARLQPVAAAVEDFDIDLPY